MKPRWGPMVGFGVCLMSAALMLYLIDWAIRAAQAVMR